MFDSHPQQQYHQFHHREFQLPFGAMIKIPTENQVDYKNLICTEADQKIINEVISTVAEKNKGYLLWNESDLRQKQIQINHVHPFKFLATIFCHPKLKSHMGKIFDDFFKRHGFLDGLGPSLEREAKKGTLARYLDDFANEIGVDAQDIRNLFAGKDWNKSEEWQYSDWEKLVRFLIHS